MYVPNFVPEPLEVPQNVTAAPYRQRIRFIRGTLNWHAASVGLAVITGWFYRSVPDGNRIPVLAVLSVLVALLLLLDGWRIRTRGSSLEARWSRFALPFITVLVGMLFADLPQFPGWALAVGCLSVTLYANCSGRDFSFPAAFLAGFFGSAAVIAFLDIRYGVPARTTAIALGTNFLFLFYLVYDLASLQARRHTNEKVAAAVDLYRDVFNIFGYVPRVISHWRKHRIWDVVREAVLRTWQATGRPGAPK